LAQIKSVSGLIDQGLSPEEILEEILEGFRFRILAEREVSYQCQCSRERTRNLLVSMGRKEIQEILEEEGQVEVKCHFCGGVYCYEKEEIDKLFDKVKDINEKRENKK